MTIRLTGAGSRAGIARRLARPVPGRPVPGRPVLAGPVLAGVVAAGLILGSAPALAVPVPPPVTVPCRVTALTADLAAAASGETLQLTPLCRYVLTTALPVITGNLTIQGNGATVERSHAAGTPDFALLTVLRSGDVAIQHLNFRNGDSQYGGAIDNGGIPAQEAVSTVTVTGGTFTGNTAQFGGAIFDNGGTRLTVRGATFTGNSAGAGGGIYNSLDIDPADGNVTVLDVTGSTFTGNKGGGIDNVGNATVITSTFTRNAPGIDNETGGRVAVSHSEFSQNSRSGLFNEGISSVTGSNFTGNSTPYLGGGIDNTSEGPTELTVTGTSFTENSAGEGGGGIYNYDAAQVTRDTFTGNTAPVGGGMDNEWYAVVTNSTFRLNRAGSDGGGLYNDCQAAVSGSTFALNRASSDGGGIDSLEPNPSGCFHASLVLTGSRVRGNVAGADGGGLYAAEFAGAPVEESVTITGSQVIANIASEAGGGIYNFGRSTVSLTSAVVAANLPGNCAPANSVPGCAG